MKKRIDNLVEQWLFLAEEDFLSAGYLAKTKLYGNSCFHSQQAVEKYLKGLMALKIIKFPKTHSLSKLVNLLKSARIKIKISPQDLD